MEKYPELAELVGKETSEEFIQAAGESGGDVEQNKALLKKVFSALMHSPQEKVTASLSKLVARLNESKADDTISKLVLRLDQQYPGGDVGVFSSLLLNYVSMEPGQAIFLGANEPHAYLSGGKKTFRERWAIDNEILDI
jgi:mannose-6-phosphate isomerase